jgi:predicted DNA-binding transcriptional regulator AlpA
MRAAALPSQRCRAGETSMHPSLPAPLEATLSMKNLVAIYNVSKRTIWRWVKEGRLPPPIAVTRRVRRWKASDIQQHLNSLQRVRR